MNESEVLSLVRRYRIGDELAAHELFMHYAQRLIPVVGKRLSIGLRQRVDPEDLVQSALGSFVRRDHLDPFPLANGAHLWSLLVGIVLNKVRQHVRSNQSAKNDLRREVANGNGVPLDVLDSDLAPDVEAALQELLTVVVEGLRPIERQILEMHLAGHDVPEISAAVSRAPGRVRHVLSDLSRALKQRFDEESSRHDSQ